MTEVWFTSDHHFGHARINELAGRPFSSPEEAAETMIERHNERVEPGDAVWLLGDLCMGTIAESLPYLARLNGRKHLISGNHDRTFAGQESSPQKAAEWVKRYKGEGGLSSIITGTGFAKAGRPVQIPFGFEFEPVWLWHFPYTGDSQEGECFDRWRPQPPAKGTRPWLLHGHTHSTERVDVANRQIHVGVDAWDFAPVRQDQIRDLIRAA